MKKKFKFFLPAKTWLTILAVVCCLFIGVTFFTDVLTKPLQKLTSSIIVPLQKGVNGIGLWLTDKKDMFESVENLQKENALLKEELELLQQENLKYQEEQVELNYLRELYKLDNIYSNYEKIGANVIGRNSDNWYSVFTIDKGSKDGIEVDMNVIAGNGLVGIVYQVSDNYSLVRSIIDDESKVSSMLINTSDICAVSGDLKLMDKGYVKLGYLDAGVTIKDGDMIVTSSISDKFLAGILIGYAKDVKLDANNLTQSGYLVPAVDFKHIQKVLVITEKKITSDTQK
jgi:rod shape-determining protein MreC